MRALIPALMFTPIALANTGLDLSLFDRQAEPLELLIQYEDEVQALYSTWQMNEFRQSSRSLHTARHQLMRLKEGTDLAGALEQIKNQPGVKRVQPNYRYHANALPSDPMLGQQWALANSDELTIERADYQANNPPRQGGFDIAAADAWELVTDCRDQVIAVVDTGIHYGHADLIDNMWQGDWQGAVIHGWDFIDNDSDPSPDAAHENHGTHVAGIIAAVGDNGLGSAGICWQASIMSLRVLDEDGNGTTATLGEGIRWAVDNGATIINMSLGGTGGYDYFLADAISYAEQHDVLVIASAGNSTKNNDESPHWPWNFEQGNLLCVTALDQGAELAWFANYGENSVDLAAPGTNILSTWTGPSIEISPFDLNRSSGWTALTANTCASYELLVLPAYWGCVENTEYGPGMSEWAWTNLDLSQYQMASLEFAVGYDTEPSMDFISVVADPAGGHPSNGKPYWSGSGQQSFTYQAAKLDKCLTSDCTVGFHFLSNGVNQRAGVGIGLITLETFEDNSEAVRVISGTSMATPVVTGIAALVRSFQPGYSAADTAEALRSGGQKQSGLKVKSGRSANAMGSLTWLKPPEGLSAEVHPVE